MEVSAWLAGTGIYHVLFFEIKVIEIKPYKCYGCYSFFARSDYLKIHMRSHNGEKAYCDVCNTSFAHLVNLKSHMHTHNGESKEFYRPTLQQKTKLQP